MKLDHLLFLVSLFAVLQTLSALTTAQEISAAQIVGEWEGSLSDENSSQDIICRFERLDTGSLNGFMGPIQAGAVLPMSKILFEPPILSFTLEGQGVFTGKITTESSKDITKRTISGIFENDGESSKLTITQQPLAEKTPRDFRGSDRSFLGTEHALTSSVATGDVDGDGDVDIVIGNGRHWPQRNKVFYNNGGGRFSKSVFLSPQFETTYKTLLLDVDGDSDLDIVVGNESLENVVHLNDGRGNYTVGSTFGGLKTAVRDLVAVDVNQDGQPDLLEFTRGGPNAIYLNDGSGKFNAKGSIGAKRDSIGAAAAADLNRDGHQDLVLVDRDRGQNTILYGSKEGFQEPRYFGREKDETHDLAIADMDGDGFLDIVTVSIGQTNQVHFGDNNGTFVKSAEFGNSSRSYAVALGDFDNDGDMDVVEGNQIEKNAAYFNNGDGRTFQRLGFGTAAHTYDISVADFNGDGFLDVVTANSDSENQVFGNIAPSR